MWVCRLPVHIGPPGSRKFAVDFREKSVHSAGSMWASAPTASRRIRTAIQVSNAGRFYRSYSNVTAHEFGCTITGGAYHSARRVTMCVRND